MGFNGGDLVVLGRDGCQIAAFGAPDQKRPATAFDRLCRGAKLSLQILKASEVLFDLLGELAAGGFEVARGAHIAPEKRVIDVSGAVECQAALDICNL